MKYKSSKEEKEILDSYERCEWKSINDRKIKKYYGCVKITNSKLLQKKANKLNIKNDSDIEEMVDSLRS